MIGINEIHVAQETHPLDNNSNGRPVMLEHVYLTTKEAAAYLRKGELWLLRRPDIPFLKSRPNLYKKADLDNWFERNKFEPTVK